MLISYEGTRAFVQMRSVSERAFIFKPWENIHFDPWPVSCLQPPQSLYSYAKKTPNVFLWLFSFCGMPPFLEDVRKKWGVYTNHSFQNKKATQRPSEAILFGVNKYGSSNTGFVCFTLKEHKQNEPPKDNQPDNQATNRTTQRQSSKSRWIFL